MSSLENIENVHFLKTYINPNQFISTLEPLQQQFPLLLQNFIQYYVYFYKDPESQEYEQMFNTNEGNINSSISQMFSLFNDVEHNTNIINDRLLELNKLIEREKKLNKKLKKKLGMLENTANASEELIDNYKDMYESEYLRIWGICLSIIIAIFAILYVYNFGGKNSEAKRPIQKSIGNNLKNIENNLKNDYRKYRKYRRQ